MVYPRLSPMPRLSPSTKGCRKNSSCASLSTKFQFWIGLGDDGQFKNDYKQRNTRTKFWRMYSGKYEIWVSGQYRGLRNYKVTKYSYKFGRSISNVILWISLLKHFLLAVSKMFFLLLVVSFVVSVARGRAINSVPRITEEQVNNFLLRFSPSLTCFAFPSKKFFCAANNKFRIMNRVANWRMRSTCRHLHWLQKTWCM